MVGSGQGYKRGSGRASENGGWKTFSHPEMGRGVPKTIGVVLKWVLKVLTILEGGTISFHPLKGGCKKFYSLLRGVGTQQVSDPRFSHFVAIPSS